MQGLVQNKLQCVPVIITCQSEEQCGSLMCLSGFEYTHRLCHAFIVVICETINFFLVLQFAIIKPFPLSFTHCKNKILRRRVPNVLHIFDLT